MKKENVIICPPCGENVASATKRGANKVLPIVPRLPHLTAVLPPQGREITTHGFTLIELLVVVLIIGILAAVAVPQYRIAVEKSHAIEAIANVKAVANAQKVYYLANGEYATDISKLDITNNDSLTLSSNSNWYFSLTTASSNPRVYAGRQGKNVSYGKGRWYIIYELTKNTLYCATQQNDETSKKICKTFSTERIVCPSDPDLICYPI